MSEGSVCQMAVGVRGQWVSEGSGCQRAVGVRGQWLSEGSGCQRQRFSEGKGGSVNRYSPNREWVVLYISTYRIGNTGCVYR